jgi:hypothetical protein
MHGFDGTVGGEALISLKVTRGGLGPCVMI